MKLTDICEEIIWEGEIDGSEYVGFVINEIFSVRPRRGGLLKQAWRKGAAAITANPGLAALGALGAVAGYSAYKRNQRDTIRLFAKNYSERKTYQTIVNDLLKSGYRKVKEKHSGSGYIWELKKK